MDLATAIGLDLVAVGCVLYCAYAAAKKGFIRTVIQMIAYIVVIAVAAAASKAVAPVIYERLVRPALTENFYEQAAPKSIDNAMLARIPLSAGLKALSEDALDALEDMLPEDLGDLPDETQDLLEDLSDTALRPVMEGAIGMIAFVAIFAALSIITNLILSALGIINHLPVIGPVNAMFGCLVGILQGVLLVCVLAILLRGILNLYPHGWWVISSEDVVQKSYIFKYFYNPALLAKWL